MTKLLAAALFLMVGTAAMANEPYDKVTQGLCLEFKVDGQSKPCNGDMLMKDDGKGNVDFITGFLGEKGAKKTVIDFELTQRSDLENSYGYAFPVRGVRLMTFDDTDSKTILPATGICFMVKPNPVKAGKTNIRQDIVIMCSASITDANANSKFRKFDWKFVQ